jgi:hypothetical protein
MASVSTGFFVDTSRRVGIEGHPDPGSMHQRFAEFGHFQLSFCL